MSLLRSTYVPWRILSLRYILIIFSYNHFILIIYCQDFVVIWFFSQATAGASTFVNLSFYLNQIQFKLFINNFQTFLLIVDILTNFLWLLNKFFLYFNVVLEFNFDQTRFLIWCSRFFCIRPTRFNFGRRWFT